MVDWNGAEVPAALEMDAHPHGGTDALGVPKHDFSTNRNACGPCPVAVDALHAAHSAQYPDPAYTALRAQLAAWHGVAVHRIVMGSSSSELIHRLTQHAVQSGAVGITLPQHHYGDYAQAAAAWGLAARKRTGDSSADNPLLAARTLHWACEPASPVGSEEPLWALWQALPPGSPTPWVALDCAYRPLWLEGPAPAREPALWEACWQLWTPNKALGMTGVRAAYAIAPVHASAQQLAALRQLAPSWVVGSHGVAMLQAWVTPQVQQWLQQSLVQLRQWKRAQLALCARLGWQVLPGHCANYLVARLPLMPDDVAAALQALRNQGIKLRECTSFGLPGYVRLGVLAPASQYALERAWCSL